MAMNNMKSNSQILPQLTTQWTQKNEENSLISLIVKQKVGEEKF